MTQEVAEILSRISNSGIVHMPGRRFPGIVMQGDSLSGLFDSVAFALRDAKNRRDKESYYEFLMFAETLQEQLQHYERTLASRGMRLPYSRSINERLVTGDFDNA